MNSLLRNTILRVFAYKEEIFNHKIKNHIFLTNCSPYNEFGYYETPLKSNHCDLTKTSIGKAYNEICPYRSEIKHRVP